MSYYHYKYLETSNDVHVNVNACKCDAFRPSSRLCADIVFMANAFSATVQGLANHCNCIIMCNMQHPNVTIGLPGGGFRPPSGAPSPSPSSPSPSTLRASSLQKKWGEMRSTGANTRSEHRTCTPLEYGLSTRLRALRALR